MSTRIGRNGMEWSHGVAVWVENTFASRSTFFQIFYSFIHFSRIRLERQFEFFFFALLVLIFRDAAICDTKRTSTDNRAAHQRQRHPFAIFHTESELFAVFKYSLIKMSQMRMEVFPDQTMINCVLFLNKFTIYNTWREKRCIYRSLMVRVYRKSVHNLNN